MKPISRVTVHCSSSTDLAPMNFDTQQLRHPGLPQHPKPFIKETAATNVFSDTDKAITNFRQKERIS